MAIKPWLQNTFIDRRRSTLIGYPPKDKHIWRSGSFPASEHFNGSNFGPLDGFNERQGNQDRCTGRVLKPDQLARWGCDTQLKGGEGKTYQTKVSGAVGGVTYTMDPFWSAVNDDGDLATIDENGVITLEDNVCQGPYPPWIIYFVCDACGCSQGTIWLEDCSEDCSVCADADCEAGLEVSGSDTIAASASEQYTLNNAQGTTIWSVSGDVGTGGGISQSGLLTVGVGACGTLTVAATDSCCGTYTKSVRASLGVWGDEVTLWDTKATCGCPGFCEWFVHPNRFSGCFNSCTDIPGNDACNTKVANVCGCSGATPYAAFTEIVRADWICPP